MTSAQRYIPDETKVPYEGKREGCISRDCGADGWWISSNGRDEYLSRPGGRIEVFFQRLARVLFFSYTSGQARVCASYFATCLRESNRALFACLGEKSSTSEGGVSFRLFLDVVGFGFILVVKNVPRVRPACQNVLRLI